MDYPALLPPGLHPKTWGELEALCVKEFPLSRSRVAQFDGLRQLVTRLIAEAIEGKLWIDGSFLTRKIDPGDIDVVLEIEHEFYKRASANQRVLLSWLGTQNPAMHAEIKRRYACDSYVFVKHSSGTDMHEYWLRQFGVDRSGKEKGIAVLSIRGGVL